ncbi:MAG: tributyrin esterase [bacterium]|nr:tributyrin esterase [bacterium]
MENSRGLNKYLYDEIKVEKKRAVVVGINSQDSVAVGWEENVEIAINGHAGDFLGALNNGASIILSGNAKRFVGDTMRSGKIIINGNCGEGAGMYMYGGQIIINGNAGNNIGQISKGGVILTKGVAGDFVGLYLTGGNIIVLGNIGEKVGDWMIKGRIFVGGKIASLGNNTIIQKLNSDDKSFLEVLFTENKIKFQLDNIKKIVPKELRPFYK